MKNIWLTIYIINKELKESTYGVKINSGLTDEAFTTFFDLVITIKVMF